MNAPPSIGDRWTLPASALGALFDALRARGLQVIAPAAEDGAIVYAPLDGPGDLPRGWTDHQAPGRYRLERRGDGAYFGFAVGPTTWKRYLHEPEVTLWRARQTAGGLEISGGPDEHPAPGMAFLGARACELAAIAIQDRVLAGAALDPRYASRRAELVLIAVQCGGAAATCFCSSMGAGPRVGGGFDLCLTELLDGEHRFVVEVGSAVGGQIVQEIAGSLAPNDPADRHAPERAADQAASEIGRRLPTEGLREALLDALEGPHWDAVAERCLGCANCTQVCPTCFCTTTADVTDLRGDAARVRTWSSCFSLDFSYVHGGSVRQSLGARYRQWLTHKLATWWDQFDTSGCVGCGRCVAWCPAGIDIVAEARAAAGREET